MIPELPDHLDLDLPSGPFPDFKAPPLSGETLAAWRRRTYQLVLLRDPDFPTRWIPKTLPFELD